MRRAVASMLAVSEIVPWMPSRVGSLAIPRYQAGSPLARSGERRAETKVLTDMTDPVLRKRRLRLGLHSDSILHQRRRRPAEFAGEPEKLHQALTSPCPHQEFNRGQKAGLEETGIGCRQCFGASLGLPDDWCSRTLPDGFHRYSPTSIFISLYVSPPGSGCPSAAGAE
jgi:hypothetical protein